jgi:hypothetical protein
VMSRLFWLVVVAAFIAGCGSPTAPDPAHNVDGLWDGSNSLDGFVHFVVVGGSAGGVVNVSHFSLSYTIQNPIGQTTPCSSSWILGNQLTTTLAHVTNGGAAFHAGQPGFRFATNGDGLPIPFEGFETVIAIFTGDFISAKQASGTGFVSNGLSCLGGSFSPGTSNLPHSPSLSFTWQATRP